MKEELKGLEKREARYLDRLVKLQRERLSVRNHVADMKVLSRAFRRLRREEAITPSSGTPSDS